jgi:hypothetical protein
MQVISARELLPAPFEAPPGDLPYTITLEFGGIAVALRTPIGGLVDEMRSKYGPHVSRTAPAFEYFVWPSPSGYRFWTPSSGGRQWTSGALPPDALAFLTDAALLSAVVRSHESLRSLHAAAICVNGNGAAIVGDSTAGKTTTLLACARAGAQVFSDERALLRDGVLQPFLRRCSVREGGRAMLLAECEDDALGYALRAHRTICLRECFGATALAQPAPLNAVIVLEGRAHEPDIREASALAALPAVTRWFDMRGGVMERASSALRLLRGVRCYTMRLGTPAQSARAIVQLMGAI